MISLWDTLGIEPTDDITAIKRAFAAKAKMYHPEEHPEEFKRLQNAYKQALNYAKHKPVIFFDTASVNEKAAGIEKLVNSEKTETESDVFDFGELENYLIDPITSFENELDYIIWNPYLRNDIRLLNVWLNREEYRGFFQREDCLNNFLDRLLLEEKGIFYRDTIVFFKRYWDNFSGESFKNLYQCNEKWNLILQSAVTKAESQGLSAVWNQDALLSEWSDIPDKGAEESYLSRYFLYASENREILKENNINVIKAVKDRKYRSIFTAIMSLTAVFFIILCIAVFCDIRNRPGYFDKLRSVEKDYAENHEYSGYEQELEAEFDSLIAEYGK